MELFNKNSNIDIESFNIQNFNAIVKGKIKHQNIIKELKDSHLLNNPERFILNYLPSLTFVVSDKQSKEGLNEKVSTKKVMQDLNGFFLII